MQMTAGRRLLVATLGLFVLRAVLSLPRTGPLVVADEAGYLLNARALTGGLHGTLTTAPFYRGGYSLLLTPLVALHLSPETTYRLVLVLNAALAASLVPLLYAVLTRCFSVRPDHAVWAAVAAAAYPSATTLSQVALSENALFPLVVAWALLAGGLAAARGRSALWLAAATGGTAAACYVVHGRMVVVGVATVLEIAWLAAFKRISPFAAGLGVATLAAGLAAARWLDDFLVRTNWGGQRPDEVGDRLSSVDNVDGVLRFLGNLVGSTWYLTVGTLGVVALLLLSGSARRHLDGLRRRDAPAASLVLGLLLVVTAGLLVLSALSFPDVERPDMLIYGRYAEVTMPPLLALALATLGRGLQRLRVRAALVATSAIVIVGTVAVVALRAGAHPTGKANRWNIASLPFFTFDLQPTVLVAAGLVTLGALAVVAAVILRRPAALAPLALVAFLAVAAVAERNPVLSSERSVYGGGWTSPASAVHGGPIGYDLAAYDVFGLYAYQWFLPHDAFVPFRGRVPATRHVIAARETQRRGWTMVWASPHQDQAIFRVSPKQRASTVSP